MNWWQRLMQPELTAEEDTRLDQLETKLDQQLLAHANTSDRLAHLEAKLDQLLTRSEVLTTLDRLDNTDLTEQVNKLAKTQFKANALQESHSKQQADTLASLQTALDALESTHASTLAATRLDWLCQLFPVMDSLDAALDSGQRQLAHLPLNLEARAVTQAWLEGVRLARLRLLDVLALYDVTPIPTVGQPFDPMRHIAVATDDQGQAPDNTIVNQDRAGYMTPDRVLREAEVVVARQNPRNETTPNE